MHPQPAAQAPTPWSLLYPVLGGVCGFAATLVGSHFFSLAHPYAYVGLGVGLFLLCNHLLYKLQFNSYHSNGATSTTVLIFTAQAVCMAVYKWQEISWTWGLGVALVLLGTLLMQDTPDQQQHSPGQQGKSKQN